MATATATKKGAATKAAPAAEVETEETEPKKKAPPKDPKSLTTEEFDAAIAGNLEPRKVKGTPDQPGLQEVGERGPKGRPIGLTTGLPIQGAWIYIFQCNERAPEKPAKISNAVGREGIAMPESGKMTDEQLSAWMKAEFPGRTNNTFDHVSGCRNAYNKGQPTRGTPSKVVSQAYDADGNVIVKLSPEERAAARATEKAERDKKAEKTAPAPTKKAATARA